MPPTLPLGFYDVPYVYPASLGGEKPLWTRGGNYTFVYDSATWPAQLTFSGILVGSPNTFRYGYSGTTGQGGQPPADTVTVRRNNVPEMYAGWPSRIPATTSGVQLHNDAGTSGLWLGMSGADTESREFGLLVTPEFVGGGKQFYLIGFTIEDYRTGTRTVSDAIPQAQLVPFALNVLSPHTPPSSDRVETFTAGVQYRPLGGGSVVCVFPSAVQTQLDSNYTVLDHGFGRIAYTVFDLSSGAVSVPVVFDADPSLERHLVLCGTLMDSNSNVHIIYRDNTNFGTPGMTTSLCHRMISSGSDLLSDEVIVDTLGADRAYSMWSVGLGCMRLNGDVSVPYLKPVEPDSAQGCARMATFDPVGSAPVITDLPMIDGDSLAVWETGFYDPTLGNYAGWPGSPGSLVQTQWTPFMPPSLIWLANASGYDDLYDAWTYAPQRGGFSEPFTARGNTPTSRNGIYAAALIDTVWTGMRQVYRPSFLKTLGSLAGTLQGVNTFSTDGLSDLAIIVTEYDESGLLLTPDVGPREASVAEVLHPFQSAFFYLPRIEDWPTDPTFGPCRNQELANRGSRSWVQVIG